MSTKKWLLILGISVLLTTVIVLTIKIDRAKVFVTNASNVELPCGGRGYLVLVGTDKTEKPIKIQHFGDGLSETVCRIEPGTNGYAFLAWRNDTNEIVVSQFPTTRVVKLLPDGAVYTGRNAMFKAVDVTPRAGFQTLIDCTLEYTLDGQAKTITHRFDIGYE